MSQNCNCLPLDSAAVAVSRQKVKLARSCLQSRQLFLGYLETGETNRKKNKRKRIEDSYAVWTVGGHLFAYTVCTLVYCFKLKIY